MCWILLGSVRRRFQLVNHDLRESVVLWIVDKQHCDYTCALVQMFCKLYIVIITFYTLMYLIFVFYIPADGDMVGRNI